MNSGITARVTNPTTAKGTSPAGAKQTNPMALTPITGRDLSHLLSDTAAVKALAQAAINVELFTIPLYMAAMTSLSGTHEINGKGVSYYQGRAWPGMNTSANPTTANQKAYNAIFAVFIEEMLHLQLAANVATSMGFAPDFQSSVLQTVTHGWRCYGMPGTPSTAIPHIIDLPDMVAPYNTLTVTLGAVSATQLSLFEVIEQPHDIAVNNIQPSEMQKYFPTVPFANWSPFDTEMDLPMFGTIGWMYACYMQYLTMTYTDGQTLYAKLFQANSVQQDMFNWAGGSSSSHPMAEFPGMSATVTAADATAALVQVLDMIVGICDQGEGGSIITTFRKQLAAKLNLNYVPINFQPSATAMTADYPSYTSSGAQAPQSADSNARSASGSSSHYAVFGNVLSLVQAGQVTTFPTWFANGNSWTSALLTSVPPNPNPPTNIPSTTDVANALNALRTDPTTPALLNSVIAGSIAGITSGLNAFWQDQNGSFPFPAMVGSGDRMTLYWATVGATPDLSGGVQQTPDPGRSASACQGLNYMTPPPSPNCGTVSVFHSCRGTNACAGQGGCGFAQSTSGGGGGCGTSSAARVRKPRMTERVTNGCGGPTPPANLYSAPGDNACNALGGCAVPISASQLFPEAGTMQVYDLFADPTKALGTIPFAVGDSVYDTAWTAYSQVLQSRGTQVPSKPTASTLRVALPPST